MQVESDCQSFVTGFHLAVSSRFRDVPACSSFLHREILVMHSFLLMTIQTELSHLWALVHEYCHYKHKLTALSLRPCFPFFWVHIQSWNCWICCILYFYHCCLPDILVYSTQISLLPHWNLPSIFFLSGYLKTSSYYYFILFFFTVNIGTQTTGPGGEGCSIPGQSLLTHRGPSSAHSAHGVRLPTHCGLLVHNFG